MSNHYMIFLATEIAQKNNLSLHTHNPDVWTSSTFFLNAETVQDSFYPGKCYDQESKALLASIFLNDIFPSNLLDIPASEILNLEQNVKTKEYSFRMPLTTSSIAWNLSPIPRFWSKY